MPRDAQRTRATTERALASSVVAILVSMAAETVVLAGNSWRSEEIKTTKAKVESIEIGNDLVYLRDADGRSLNIVIPSAIRASERIAVGDTLAVQYRETVAVSIKAKQSRARSDDAVSDAPAPPSDKNVVSSTGTLRTGIVQSINRSAYTIAYKDADGLSRDATITDPEARKIVDVLKPGDEVEVRTAVIVSVRVERDQ